MSTWNKSRYRLIGDCPLIVHNGRLSNPLDYYSKELRKISGKKSKTDADHERMAEIEFKGGLYLSEEGLPVLPSDGIDAIINAGAKKTKEGIIAKAGCFCTPTPHPALIYDGPKTVDGLWADEKFRLMVSVKIGKVRVMRTRPIFQDWMCDVEINFNTTVCNEEQIFGWLRTAGEQCGAFDWRPKYGRFHVERIK